MPDKNLPKPLKFLSPVHKARRQIAVYCEQRVSDFGLSVSEGHLVSYLAGYAPCTIAEMLRVFGHKASTMTSMLDRLEDAGYLKRQPDPDDRRRLVVSLTARGERKAARVREHTEALEAEIAKFITAADRRGFENVMRAIGAATEVELRPVNSSPKNS